MNERDSLAAAIIADCRRMNTLGINQGKSGNISARWHDGFLITPSGMEYDSLTPDDIVWCGFDGTITGRWQPSSEWRIHFDILQARPEIGAVVHTHGAYCTTLACMGLGIPAFHYMVAMAGGSDIRCAPYATFATQELSDNALVALEGRRACLLANHGMLALGKDLKAAMALTIEVEALAGMYWRVLQIGKPIILPDEEMAVVLGKFAGYGQAKTR